MAVKGQDISSNLFFGESWVFQYNKGRDFDCDKEIFKETNDNYVSFVSLNIPRRLAEIKAVVKVKWLHENNMFKEMQQDYLKSNKVAVYFEDLIKHSDLFQI